MRNKWNHELSIVLKTVVTSAILVLVFYAGTFVGQAGLEPQANANPNPGFSPTVEARLVETNTVQYVDTPAIEVKYVELVKSMPIELRSFSDLEELKQWLEDRKNVTPIRFQYPDTTVDCDDFALALQRSALEDGYLMSFQIIEPGKYNSLFESSKIPLNTLHAVNLAVIGNNAYFVEPQTGEIVFAAGLD